MPTRVAIVEDDADTRELLSDLISSSREFSLTGTFANGRTALQELPKINPDLILMDMHMEGLSGIDCTAKLKELHPEMTIIMVTGASDLTDAAKALQAGASGYITKPFRNKELLEAVRFARSGGVPISQTISNNLARTHQAPDAGPDPISPAFAKLTPRQQDILRLAAQGLHYKEIADQLKLSQRTVTNHFHQIYQRLGVTNRVEALNKIRVTNPKA